MYGHIHKLAEAEKAGIEASGGTVDLYQYAFPRPHIAQQRQARSLPRD